MSRPGHVVCLLLGLALLAGALPLVAPAEVGLPAAETLPAPQWVGGADARGKANLVWIRNPAFAAVRVYRREEGAASFQRLADVKGNSWVDTTVRPGQTYRYYLAGVGLDGQDGRASVELVVRIGAGARRPPAPPKWEGSLTLDDGFSLLWTVREGEDVVAYNVYRRAPPDTAFQLVGSSRQTSYRDGGLEPGRTYVYVLTALDTAFQETAYSEELSVTFKPAPAPLPEVRAEPSWRVRRTRLVALLNGGDQPFLRPADVAVGPQSGSVYVADSGRKRVYVFSGQGAFRYAIGAAAGAGGGPVFSKILGLAVDAGETLYVVDAGASALQAIASTGGAGRRIAVGPDGAPGPVGLIDAAPAPNGGLYIVDNLNNRLLLAGRNSPPAAFGEPGREGTRLSAPTFCAVDTEGNLYVAEALGASVRVFSPAGELVRTFGRFLRGPGGFGRPKGLAVSAAGEVYVADSWFNTVQVFDRMGRFDAILADEEGRPLNLGSPNGVALGPGRRVVIAERLAARVQIREILDEAR